MYMKRHPLTALLLMSALLSFITSCTRHTSTPEDLEMPTEQEQEKKSLEVGTQIGMTETDHQVRVKTITKIMDDGKSVDWSPVHNLILSSKPMPDEEGYLYYDVIVFKPDGSEMTCLTCDKPELPNRHQGNPAWHPSGDWIIFTAEKETIFQKKDPYGDEWFSIPGKGLFHDLYVMNSEGTQFHKVYETSWRPLDKQGLVHPQFSHDGQMVIWAQREGDDPQEKEHHWGIWAIYLADFQIEDGTPQLSNVRSCHPGEQAQFYEVHGFSEDDEKILYSANQIADQPPTGMDIYVMDISSGGCGESIRLTTTFDDWDEHAHFSPDQTKIAWISSAGFNVQYPEGYSVWGKYLITELWIMNADGTGKQPLTYYNNADHEEFTGGRTIVADSAWNPDGSKLIVCVTYTDEDDLSRLTHRELHIIELD